MIIKVKQTTTRFVSKNHLNAEVAFYKADHHLQVVGRADSCNVS
jgi:hypothetical protein